MGKPFHPASGNGCGYLVAALKLMVIYCQALSLELGDNAAAAGIDGQHLVVTARGNKYLRFSFLLYRVGKARRESQDVVNRSPLLKPRHRA